MVRSGCVRRRRRAGSPTMTLPSGSRLTTEGQSVLPYGPGIHFGRPVCGSVYATRLLVVPRSIPTMRPISVFNTQSSVISQKAKARINRLELQQFLLNVGHQIPNVRAAIQQLVQLRHDLFSRGGVTLQGGVPFACCDLKLRIDFSEFFLKILLGGLEA